MLKFGELSMLQFLMVIILRWLLIINIFCWIATSLRNYWATKNMPYINVEEKDLTEILNQPLPRISVLVPARNESHRVLRQCIESLCAQTYPNLEIIAVNDCSTDNTGDILDDLAKTNPRLKVIHGAPPPSGWLGKPHAMYQASQAATGDWLLATDADIIFHPKVINAAINYALKNQLDVLALLPGGEFGSFWECVVLPVFVYSLVATFPPHLANKPGTKHALASGGFILMRREAHQKIGGYERIKDYVIDDIYTAVYLKEGGYRFRVLDSRDTVYTRSYYGLGDIWEGFSKNTFAGLNHNYIFAFVTIVFLMVFAFTPFLSLAVGIYWSDNILIYLALGSYLISVFIFLGLDRFLKIPWGYALINWVGIVVLALIILNSTWKQTTGQGVTWKSRTINPPEG
jgi:chlorobactene glucosyltransferase